MDFSAYLDGMPRRSERGAEHLKMQVTVIDIRGWRFKLLDLDSLPYQNYFYIPDLFGALCIYIPQLVTEQKN